MIDKIFSIIKALGLAIIYSLGYKQGSDKKSLDQIKAELDFRSNVEKSREEIRKKYSDIKSETPDDWDDVERLYKEYQDKQVN